tara:strand:- start:9452 stop:9853 length:402 start_codon:yes stop_codon:yes gene_type:complete
MIGNFQRIMRLMLTKQRKGDPESSGIESQKEQEDSVLIEKLSKENDREIDILKQENNSLKEEVLKLKRTKLSFNVKVVGKELYVKDNENKVWYKVSADLIKKDLDRSKISLIEKDREDQDDKDALRKSFLSAK